MTTDQPTYHMIAEHGRLAPASPLDQERLDGFAEGTEIECSMKPARNGVLIRKLYGIVGLVVKQCETPWQKADEAVQALKDGLGLAEHGVGLHGQEFRYLRSLNDLGEYELLEFMDGCWLWLRKITGIDPLTLTKATGDTTSAAASDASDPEGGIGSGVVPFPDSAGPASDPQQSELDATTGKVVASQEAGPTPDPASEPAAVDIRAERREMTSKLFRLASDALTIEERLAALASARPAWEERLPGHAALVAQIFETIARVVRGQLPADAARKFIAQLRD